MSVSPRLRAILRTIPSSIHIILVAHPRKSFGVVRKSDIAGSYDLSNMADNVFIIHKMNDDFRKGAKDFWRRDVVDLFEGFDNLLEIGAFGALVSLRTNHDEMLEYMKAGMPIY